MELSFQDPEVARCEIVTLFNNADASTFLEDYTSASIPD
jgi:hypothetical protein